MSMILLFYTNRKSNLNRGINFLGFRVFFYHKLIRKSNLKNFERKFNNLRIQFDEEIIGREKALESLEGWLAYCSHANTYKYRKHLILMDVILFLVLLLRNY